MTKPTRVEVVVVRDPDASNAYAVFINGKEVTEQQDGASADGIAVITHDIDAGNTGNPSGVTRTWLRDQRAATSHLSPGATQHALAVIDGYDRDDLPTNEWDV